MLHLTRTVFFIFCALACGAGVVFFALTAMFYVHDPSDDFEPLLAILTPIWLSASILALGCLILTVLFASLAVWSRDGD